jgi:hypothetical protein
MLFCVFVLLTTLVCGVRFDQRGVYGMGVINLPGRPSAVLELARHEWLVACSYFPEIKAP